MVRKFSVIIWTTLKRAGTLVAVIFLLSLMAVVFIFTNYTPVEMGPNGILLLFGLLYVVFLSTILLIGIMIKKIFHSSFTIVKAVNIASISAFAPVMILALNTIGQLQAIDLALVLTFELLALFYILRRGK